MDRTEAELELYVAPPCDRCGGLIEVDWVDITTLGDLGRGVRRFMAGETRCLTAGCCDEKGSKRVPLNRCRICQRPVGDIHSGACSEMVLSKVDDPCRVAMADCGP